MRRGPPIAVLLMALAITGCGTASSEDPVDTTLPNGTVLIASNDDIMADNLEMAADNMDAMADNIAASSVPTSMPYSAPDPAADHGNISAPPINGTDSMVAEPAANLGDE